MNTSFSGLFRRAVVLFLLFASGCKSIPTSTPIQSRSTTVSSSPMAVTPTEMNVPSTSAIQQPITNLTPLPQLDDYIIYSKSNDNEIWAINPNKMLPLLITT